MRKRAVHLDRSRLPPAWLALLLGSVACADAPTGGHRPGAPEQMPVSPSTVSRVVGESALLRAAASRYACDLDLCDWTGVPADFTWRTRDRDVAAVDPGGLVRAIGPGQTWVLAETQGLSDSAHIMVRPRWRVPPAKAPAGAERRSGSTR